MPDPVVITRPLAQARPLAESVAALGRSSIVFPLLEIHPLEDASALKAELAQLDSYSLVGFVSPNAIDAVMPLIASWPKQVGLAVMGEGSRTTLASHGITDGNATIFSPQDAERTDSETLMKSLDLEALRGKRVLIVRGESGRELFADSLRAAGIEVCQVAAYRRRAPQLTAQRSRQLHELVNGRHDWIVTSSEALRNLLQLVEQISGEAGVARIRRARLLVPHIRIAETAQTLGFDNVTMTGSGDQRLLAALQSRL